MKKLLLALAAMSLLTVSSLFAENSKECKKCAGDKDAKCCCCCKDAKNCDAAKDKASCPKSDKDAKPAPSMEKKN